MHDLQNGLPRRNHAADCGVGKTVDDPGGGRTHNAAPVILGRAHVLESMIGYLLFRSGQLRTCLRTVLLHELNGLLTEFRATRTSLRAVGLKRCNIAFQASSRKFQLLEARSEEHPSDLQSIMRNP